MMQTVIDQISTTKYVLYCPTNIQTAYRISLKEINGQTILKEYDRITTQYHILSLSHTRNLPLDSQHSKINYNHLMDIQHFKEDSDVMTNNVFGYSKNSRLTNWIMRDISPAFEHINTGKDTRRPHILSFFYSSLNSIVINGIDIFLGFTSTIHLLVKIIFSRQFLLKYTQVNFESMRIFLSG